MWIMKGNCEVGKAIEMDWSTTKTGLDGSLETIFEFDVPCVFKGHED